MKELDNYQLSCESAIDIPYEIISKKDIKIISYKYTINNTTYTDTLSDRATESFYKELASGVIPTTSQINSFDYFEYFKTILDRGKDIIHITLGTGMTNSYCNAIAAQDELSIMYPERKIFIIDSLCSSTGYGMLVLKIYEMMNTDLSINELINWIEENKTKIHHQFFSTDLTYYKRTGRVKGCEAFISNALKIWPVMRLNKDGKIVAYNKAIGKNMAIKRTIDEMEKNCNDGLFYNDYCYINHSNSINEALELRDRIENKFKNLKGKVLIFDIGKVIACHCGAGTVAVFFFGSIRK